MDFLASPEFWLALGQIIIIDILLGGDNAVVIALACRKLPPAQRTKGIIWGTAGAIVLRVILIAFAMTLLALPFLKFVGALLLVWIGVKLLAPDEEGHGDVQGSDKLLAAIKTIIVADLVMSVDNVIAIAGAAQNAGDHSFLLVVLGLLISIPIIVWGSQLVIKLMERFPLIITPGGMLLSWIAGGMLVTDPALANPDKWQWMLKMPVDSVTGEVTDVVKYGASVAGALLVLLAGLPGGLLQTPSHLFQEASHLREVVAHAEESADQLVDPQACPDVAWEAVADRAQVQLLDKLCELLWCQFGHRAG